MKTCMCVYRVGLKEWVWQSETSVLLLDISASIRTNQYNCSQLLSQHNELACHMESAQPRTHAQTVKRLDVAHLCKNSHFGLLTFGCLSKRGASSQHLPWRMIIWFNKTTAQPKQSNRKIRVIKQWVKLFKDWRDWIIGKCVCIVGGDGWWAAILCSLNFIDILYHTHKHVW